VSSRTNSGLRADIPAGHPLRRARPVPLKPFSEVLAVLARQERMEMARVALIRYTAPGGTPCVGSGLLIDARRVLTADHVAEGSGHKIVCGSRTCEVAAVLRSGTPEVDLAVLSLSEPVAGLGRLECARVDQSRVDRVSGSAVGFPRWKRSGDQRLSAQVDGWLPTAEGLESMADSGLRAALLTLVSDWIPGAPEIPAGTLSEMAPGPWGGMSGAVVVAHNLVIGVVRSYNLAAGGKSLTITPMTAVDQLPDKIRQRFWDALGIVDPTRLPLLPDAAAWAGRATELHGQGHRDPTPWHQGDPSAGRSAFVSYSHKDERYRQRLDISLVQLRRNNLISIWHDKRILPGQDWGQEIDTNLENADLILLLVSPDFLASEYAYSREMLRAVERHQSGSAIVVPIILRPSDWQDSPLGALQALPNSGRPVSSWPNRDQAWLDVAQGLRRLISNQGSRY
jgi:hypothetical protein